MVRGTRARSTVDGDVTEATLVSRIGEETGWDPDLEAAFEQLKDDFRQTQSEGTLWVYRVPLDERGEAVPNAKLAFLFSAPVQRYSSEEIFVKVQKDFMAGMAITCINLRATRKNERGVRFNQTVMIERAVNPEVSDKPQGSFADIVRAIQESNQATVMMVREMLKQPAATPALPASPPISQMRELAEIVALLSGGMGQRQQASPQVITTPAAPSVLDQLKTLRELHGFMNEFGDAGGGGGGGDGPESMLKHLSPWASVFNRLLSQQPQQPIAPPRRPPTRQPQTFDQPSPPAAQAAPIDPSTIPTPPPMNAWNGPTAPTPGVNPVIAQMREQFEALTKAANEGAQPEQVIPVVMQMIPEDSPIEDAFMQFLESNTWWQQLTAIYPPAAPQEAWFQALRAGILQAYEPEGTVQHTTE